jgi:hypothetical protein
MIKFIKKMNREDKTLAIIIFIAFSALAIGMLIGGRA